MAEILALEWGGNAGACWECWKLEPCCGEPCNPADGVRCFLCWFCPIVSFLSSAKLYAYSTNQDCACVNHILPVFIPYVGGIVVSIAMRHNLRVKVGAGLPAKDTTGILGDLIMVCIFGYCVHCQNLRSVDRGAWDWMAELSNKGFKAYEDPCIFCIDKA